jgi:VanZ family protein
MTAPLFSPRTLLIAWTVFVWVVLTAPFPAGAEGGVSYADKIAHAFIFGVWAALWHRFGRLRGRPFAAAYAVLYASLYAGAAEVWQWLLPWRSVSLADWAAGTFGAALAVLIALFVLRRG